MKTVGRLGSYITKKVYTVSGSLHPFGGAVDIIVVEQPDGSFKSSPWYVRFGKFQGVLKVKDKVVRIGVNGVEANFHMYLDPRGEAYFLREVEEGEPVLSQLSFIGETDSGPLKTLRPVKSEGSISDSCLSNSRHLDDSSDGKIVVRSTSRRSKIMGIVFGQGSASTKDDSIPEGDDGGISRMGSLERAEFAENLLELQWSTNLTTPKSKKGSRLPPFPSSNRVDGNLQVDSSVRASSTEQTQSSILAEDVETSSNSNKTSLQKKADDYGSHDISGAINHEAQRLRSVELCEGDGLGEQHTCGEMDFAPLGSGIQGQDNGSNNAHSFIHWEKSQGLEVELDGLKELRHRTLFFSGAEQEEIIYCQSGIVSSAPVSECSEEEHLLFGDLDEFRPRRVLNGSESPNSLYIESCGGVNEPYIDLVSASEEIVKNSEFGLETKLASSPVNIREIHSVSGSEAGGLAESMPNISFHIDSLDNGLLKSSSYSLDISSKPTEWTLCQDDSGTSHVNSGSVNQAVGEHSGGEDLGNDSGVAVASAIGDPSKEIGPSGGSRRVLPLYQKQLGSRRTSYSALNDTGSLESVNASDTARVENLSSLENDFHVKQKVAKQMARVITPTSEQLASLNLQEGKNIVTFTFSTPMLGNQEVDARIFLWKWNTRVVISDVDGTITKSDVLGQFMPLVGVDWSQTGVANLFCAIKENGYQLLFLSARAITQAHLTRRFLCSLMQDGKTLPEGPVVISPDGLFPSLFREVIRRAPHEFKIACLEDIKALFPPDCQPFYAGFGNRDTDEISYLKVGIPKGKIFIINPKGEVSVHHRVDRKSYHSLHDLVHGMFPSTVTFEQEDFNSWNYWKLPSPFLDV